MNVEKLKELKARMRVSGGQLSEQCALAGHYLSAPSFYNVLSGKHLPNPATVLAMRAGFIGAAKAYYPEMVDEVTEFFDGNKESDE